MRYQSLIISEDDIDYLADGQSSHHTMFHVRYQKDVATT